MRSTLKMISIGLASVAAILLACGQSETHTSSSPIPDTSSIAAVASPEDVSRPPAMTLYKTPTCGCCSKWGRHIEAAGFEVSMIDMPDITHIKRQHGVPEKLVSCHTALIEGYVVEGHVPVEDVLRLLDERPDVAGLAVPGMPIGSPGMEGPNPEHYLVYTFDSTGATQNFASHGP